jgi:hypothetical protein
VQPNLTCQNSKITKMQNLNKNGPVRYTMASPLCAMCITQKNTKTKIRNASMAQCPWGKVRSLGESGVRIATASRDQKEASIGRLF